jgi:hypothetical protein
LIVINISCKGGISSNEGWSNFWAMACHLAWSWRNKEKHEDFMRPMKQTEFVRQKLHCYTLADKAMQPGKPTRQTIIHVSWKPPSVGWVCLNIDGACRDGVIGCGGVIRGSEGEWLIGFSKLIGRGDAYIAELWGLLEGLKLAKRMSFKKIEVHVDSIGVVNDIKRITYYVGRLLLIKFVE